MHVRIGFAALGACSILVTAGLAHAEAHRQRGIAPPPYDYGICKGLTKTEFIASTTNVFTSSTSFVDVPESGFSIVTAKPGCVAITITGEASTSSGTAIEMRPLLGNNSCPPSTVDFATDEPVYRTHTMTYICNGVPAGIHDITMQYRSDTGNMVYLNHRIVTVTHR